MKNHWILDESEIKFLKNEDGTLRRNEDGNMVADVIRSDGDDYSESWSDDYIDPSTVQDGEFMKMTVLIRTDEAIDPVEGPAAIDMKNGPWSYTIYSTMRYKNQTFVHKSVKVDSDGENIINHDEIITKLEDIEIFFNYPLNDPFITSFHNEGGFTMADFHRVVRDEYRRIYREEEAASGDPGIVGPISPDGTTCVNRAQSDGPYGIWGHVIGDLYIEGIFETERGKFRLSIGS